MSSSKVSMGWLIPGRIYFRDGAGSSFVLKQTPEINTAKYITLMLLQVAISLKFILCQAGVFYLLCTTFVTAGGITRATVHEV